MIPLAFQGGTALRFLYASARYSEDLDFSLEGKRNGYDFRGYLAAIRGQFAAEGYAVEVNVNDRKVVHSAFVRFPGLPGELGLSPDLRQGLSIKLEVDTNPPAGAILATTVVRRYIPLRLQHYDQASLLAGKLHAVLQRPYLKGRDVYDLVWYLSEASWPQPNLELLNNALGRTGWEGRPLTRRSWRRAVKEKLESVDCKGVEDDVRPFLAPGADTFPLNREDLMRLLG
ncbi:MAG: nucleotidyl transferase AbiEii/AbiGii toxin family protein [Actinobacteria bacterium]|nr:nucleotidyl transferase AbiEii/AbiGii toxin family protein [Actinomycetota bacterium]MBU1944037.1 nucleotidyl transferase AbiEii/AbiGii toxin family protein [Actinomycetota bacterium]MBU2688533.1 nucleotidyl transferase AbiEii/AbiGii toxin family protein [Actinomycetota bacterium]